jgi:cell division protein ZapA
MFRPTSGESGLSKSFQISILGQNLSVKHDSGDDYVAAIAGYVGNKVQEVQDRHAGINALTVAIIAALNIADDYYRLKNDKNLICSEMDNKTENLLKILEEAR